MTIQQLLKRDLGFYRKSHLGMVLLAAVCCAVLAGAMLVGDSVRHTLLEIGRMRLANVQQVMTTADRFFRQQLASDMQQKTDTLVAPVLALNGILESPDGSVRINRVNIYGVDERFWRFAGQNAASGLSGGVRISESVRLRLGSQTTDLLLRIRPAAGLSQDLIFSQEGASFAAWPIEIAGVVSDQNLGRFDVSASQTVPLNVFVPIDWLAEKANVPGKANMLLTEAGTKDAADLSPALNEALQPEDLGLDIRQIESENVVELRTDRIFLDQSVADAAMKMSNDAVGVFTYFVNQIRCGEKSVPYSTVSAMDSQTGKTLLSDLTADEIVLNEWLSDELAADVGDAIELTYFQISPTRKLVEQSHTFTVKQVVPMMGSFADPTLMPAYPGLTEAESCSDWDSGVPIDLKRIQPRDEDYWNQYRGTPKAFIALETAQNIWANRFGTLTAVRFTAQDNSEQSIRAGLREHLDPATVGFVFNDVRKAANRAAAGSTDFAGLFAGLSMFLIASAAILLGLVFAFYVESRSPQVGLLLAVGWGWLRIFTFFIAEGALLALGGCILGAVVSVVYTYGLVLVLNAFWTQALAGLRLTFHVGPWTLLEGVFVSFIICLFAIQVSLFHRIRRPVHQLLTGLAERYAKPSKKRRFFLASAGWFCLLAGIVISLTSRRTQQQVSAFFAAGTLCLTGLIFIAAYLLEWLRSKSASFADSIRRLAVKNIPRRAGRSLTVLITLACGVFMVVGVGSNYKDVRAQARQRDSGTGGFALLAQTTLPFRAAVELTADPATNVPAIASDAVVRMRLYQKEDASCLNLNRSRQPSLLGVDPDALAARDAFSFQKTAADKNDLAGWELLNAPHDENTIPAIGDYATVVWGLGKNINETIPYQTESGAVVNLKIVGMLKDSLLQGRLLISENDFVHYFPSVDGYQVFLMDADWSQTDAQAKALQRKYRDAGMEVIPAAQKLAQYHEVENTYLAIFLVLGGLGLILGSAGLGLVLALNVWDRRGELAMMQAVGLRKSQLKQMLFTEHGLLLIIGLICGAVPAVWAVFPSILLQGAAFPYMKIVLITAAIIVSGLICIRMAVRGAIKPDLLETLRNE